MLRMLKDKLLGKLYDYYNNETYTSVSRMYPIDNNLLTTFYNLSLSPTYIVDNIYLGNAYNASNYIDLEKKDIGLVINITTEIPNYYPEQFTYYNITIKDDNNNTVLPYLDEFISFVDKYKEENPTKSIFIHCYMGSSRSASLVTAYLCRYHSMDVKTALYFIRDKRPLVNLNTTFQSDLIKWYDIKTDLPDNQCWH